MEILNQCHLCAQYVSSTKEGRAAHMRQAHGVMVRKVVPLTRDEKAVIVDRMEARIGRQHFITPESLPVPAFQKYRCNRCGPTNNEGYWLENGVGICEPCVKIETGKADLPVVLVDEEIRYRD